MVAKGPLNETGQEYGGEVCWQITVPLTAVFTSVTPTLSEALDVTVWRPLASVDALFGEVIVTLGGVVSTPPDPDPPELDPPEVTWTLTSAVRVLPAASNAVTSMVAKGPLSETG